MTLIEFFSASHIDNIAACLRLRPKKLIMVGKENEMSGPVKNYRKLLQQRAIRTTISLCDVRKKDLGEICAVLTKIVREEEECVIDLTGGDEPAIMAVGSVLAGLDGGKRSKISVQKFDRSQNAVLDCINDNRKISSRAISLTVEEMICLHGGTLYPDSYQLPKTCRAADLEVLWRIVAEDPKEWNRSISLLSEFEGQYKEKQDAQFKMDIHLPVEKLQGSISYFDKKECAIRKLLKTLHQQGIIDNRSTDQVLDYSYKSSLMRYCTQKAGNVLEVKTLLEAREVLENGAPFFQNCQMSVSIDWDGVIQAPKSHIPETRNEIDVVLMRGTTPLFISCKNGSIGEEELYKLHTVATRFAGPNARKMLIATNMNHKNETSNLAFSQRAWDMDIIVVPDAAKLTKEEWRNIFTQAMQ